MTYRFQPFQFGRRFRLFDGPEQGLQDRLLQLGLRLADSPGSVAGKDRLKLLGDIAAVQFWTSSGSLTGLHVLAFEFPEVSKLEFQELVGIDLRQVPLADLRLNGLELLPDEPNPAVFEQEELLDGGNVVIRYAQDPYESLPPCRRRYVRGRGPS